VHGAALREPQAEAEGTLVGEMGSEENLYLHHQRNQRLPLRPPLRFLLFPPHELLTPPLRVFQGASSRARLPGRVFRPRSTCDVR